MCLRHLTLQRHRQRKQKATCSHGITLAAYWVQTNWQSFTLRAYSYLCSSDGGGTTHFDGDLTRIGSGDGAAAAETAADKCDVTFRRGPRSFPLILPLPSAFNLPCACNLSCSFVGPVLRLSTGLSSLISAPD
jgi:hypothetical protein